jgi:membrane associated rhomboid family serine protease
MSPVAEPPPFLTDLHPVSWPELRSLLLPSSDFSKLNSQHSTLHTETAAMGFDNRDYANQPQPGFHLSGPRTMAVQIVLVTAGVYLLQLFLKAPFTAALALYDHWYLQPWMAYRLLTYGFLHNPGGIEHILLNMFGLWMFGRQVEQRYGRQEFLSFYLSAIIIAGVVWTISASAFGNQGGVVLGASGGVVGVLILYALNFPRQKVLLYFVIPIPMWVLAAFIVLSDLFGATHQTGSNVAFTAHLGGAAFALAYYFTGWSPGRWLTNFFSRLPAAAKPRLRVHDPQSHGNYDDSFSAGSQDRSDHQQQLNEQVDAILRKIQAEGQDSLSRSERRLLEKASREYLRKKD